LLILVGLGLIGWGLAGLDGRLQDDTLDSDAQLDLMSGQPEFGPASGHAATDAGRPIPLFRPDTFTAEGQAPFPEARYLRRRGLGLCVIPAGPVDPGYNCHGWLFAGGKFWIHGSAVPDILRDNGYQAVARPRLGDLAVFTDAGGRVTHSALVRGRGTKGALLESKWGKLGRYIHTAEKHIYAGDTLTFYRTARGSHLLSGLPVSDVARASTPHVNRSLRD
jgi:hypothetical protein